MSSLEVVLSTTHVIPYEDVLFIFRTKTDFLPPLGHLLHRCPLTCWTGLQLANQDKSVELESLYCLHHFIIMWYWHSLSEYIPLQMDVLPLSAEMAYFQEISLRYIEENIESISLDWTNTHAGPGENLFCPVVYEGVVKMEQVDVVVLITSSASRHQSKFGLFIFCGLTAYRGIFVIKWCDFMLFFYPKWPFLVWLCIIAEYQELKSSTIVMLKQIPKASAWSFGFVLGFLPRAWLYLSFRDHKPCSHILVNYGRNLGLL